MMKNKKIFVAALLILCTFCCCAFSYAAFSTSITAAGKIATNGMFDVYFWKKGSDAKYAKDAKEKLLDTKDVKIEATGMDAGSQQLKLNITVLDSLAVNSTVEFKVRVHNGGTMNAVVQASTSCDDKDTTNAFQIYGTPKDIAAGATDNLTLTFKKTAAAAVGDYSGITLTLVYTQETAGTAPSITHVHN